MQAKLRRENRGHPRQRARPRSRQRPHLGSRRNCVGTQPAQQRRPLQPVAMSFLYSHPKARPSFINDEKLTPQVVAHLAEAGRDRTPYASIKNFLASLPATARVLLGTSQSSGTLAAILGDRYIPGTSPVAMPKACKNPVQIEGISRRPSCDGVAMVRSLIEIERLINDRKEFTEIDVADIFCNRRTQELFVDTSFDTIAGYGPNGAIVHLLGAPKATPPCFPATCCSLTRAATTSTAHRHHPHHRDRHPDSRHAPRLHPRHERPHRHSHSSLPRRHARRATRCHGRMPLWKEGKSYLHGTGHGVGALPQLPTKALKASASMTHHGAPDPGMLTSNEPGVYLAVVTASAAKTSFHPSKKPRPSLDAFTHSTQ